MTWIDIILALALVGALLIGWKRGLVRVLMRAGSLLAALLLSRALAPSFVNAMEARFGWVHRTSHALRSASLPVLGEGAATLELLPAANRWLAETYERLAINIWTVLFAFMLFAAITLGLGLVARMVTKGLDLTPLGTPNRLLGAFLNVSLVGFILGALCAILLSIPSISAPAVREATLMPQLAKMAQSLLTAVLGAMAGAKS